MPFSLTTVLLTISALLSQASSVPLRQRDVFVPPVLYPHAGTVWKIGHRHNVTWDVSNPPDQITNTVGKIFLAKAGILDIDHPLADNFDILLGRIEVTVPSVSPASDYQVVVLGDSGNKGQSFTIST